MRDRRRAINPDDLDSPKTQSKKPTRRFIQVTSSDDFDDLFSDPEPEPAPKSKSKTTIINNTKLNNQRSGIFSEVLEAESLRRIQEISAKRASEAPKITTKSKTKAENKLRDMIEKRANALGAGRKRASEAPIISSTNKAKASNVLENFLENLFQAL